MKFVQRTQDGRPAKASGPERIVDSALKTLLSPHEPWEQQVMCLVPPAGKGREACRLDRGARTDVTATPVTYHPVQGEASSSTAAVGRGGRGAERSDSDHWQASCVGVGSSLLSLALGVAYVAHGKEEARKSCRTRNRHLKVQPAHDSRRGREHLPP
jgi:hypothetical protein